MFSLVFVVSPPCSIDHLPPYPVSSYQVPLPLRAGVFIPFMRSCPSEGFCKNFLEGSHLLQLPS